MSAKSKADGKNSESRFKEILAVLRRHKAGRGITPEKLRAVLEDLGPTYVKLGQIMSLHSDILPGRYCDELSKLTYEADPMPFEEVETVLEQELGREWTGIFSDFEKEPIGSASIAQVHRATLKGGGRVVVKAERPGIYDIMERDVRLLHRAAALLGPVQSIQKLVDLDAVIDEMWSVAKEEMDFLKEASNMEEFAALNSDIAYIRVPELYREYTTSKVLVMEYVEGYKINDCPGLEAEGYDLNEIGTRFAGNFLKQVMDDGFFHADPHPGNVRIQDGKIVWLDMGMMGRLSDHDRRVMVKAIEGIALKEISQITSAVLELGTAGENTDRQKLFRDIRNFLEEYGSLSFGNVRISQTMQALMDIMKENNIRMPHGMTMLARGLTHMEGVLAEISPQINMMSIATQRIGEYYLRQRNLKPNIERAARHMLRSAEKSVDIPSMIRDALDEHLKGESRFNLNLDTTDNLKNLVDGAVRSLVIGLCITALLISSSIICTTGMKPEVLGIPLLGFLGYAIAVIAIIVIVLRHLLRKRAAGRNKRKRG